MSLIVLNLCNAKLPNVAVKLISGLPEEGEGDAAFVAEKAGITPILIPEMQRSISPRNDRAAYIKISKIIRNFKPDVVHTHAAKPGAIGRLAAYHENVPVIVHTFHGHVFNNYFGKIKSSVFINIEKQLAKRTSKIIAISQSQKVELSEKYKIATPEKFAVINNGFDLEIYQKDILEKRKVFRNKWNVTENEVAIGIIGRLVPIKNIPFFIQVIKLLNQQTKQAFKAIIIGDGEEMEILRQQVITENLADKIVFTSWITAIDEAYAGIDILALTSKNEGTPTTIIEAQAAKKPVISTNVGGVADIVIENESAYLVNKTDVEGFAVKLKLLVESEKLRTNMGEVGFNYAYENFSTKKMVDKTYALYYNLLSESR